jgi:hypothetical protein
MVSHNDLNMNFKFAVIPRSCLCIYAKVFKTCFYQLNMFLSVLSVQLIVFMKEMVFDNFQKIWSW